MRDERHPNINEDVVGKPLEDIEHVRNSVKDLLDKLDAGKLSSLVIIEVGKDGRRFRDVSCFVEERDKFDVMEGILEIARKLSGNEPN